MMNAHVMMLVLASGLFSAMWSSDRPKIPGPQMMANQTEPSHHQPVSVASTRLQEEPDGADPAADPSILTSMLQPVRAFRPGDRVVVKTARLPDALMDKTASEFKEMAGSGQSLKIMLDEITKTSVSTELNAGDRLWSGVQGWFTTTRESWRQSWTRWQRAKEVSQQAQRTTRQ